MSVVSSEPEAESGPLVRGALEGLLVPLFCLVLSAFVLAIGLENWPGYSEQTSSNSQTLGLACLLMIMPLLVLLLYLRWRQVSWRALTVLPLTRAQFWQLTKAAGFYLLLSIGLLQLADILLPTVDLMQDQDLGLAEPGDNMELGLMFLLLVILTPITEETLFRGYMFRGFARSWGWLPAALISAALFGLAHGQLNVGLDTAALGFISANLIQKTDSLTPSILLHGAKNLVAFSLLYGPTLLS